MKAWVARDQYGDIELHNCKPRKCTDAFGIVIWKSLFGLGKVIDVSDLPEDINPQWSDIEPIKVELKIERV